MCFCLEFGEGKQLLPTCCVLGLDSAKIREFLKKEINIADIVPWFIK